jgi:hypothetical protein
VVEEGGHAVAAQSVPVVLEPVDLHDVTGQVGAVAQARDRAGGLRGGLDEHLRELDRLLHRRLDPVDRQRVGRLLGVVDDVVDGGGQSMAVGDPERDLPLRTRVQPVDDVVGDPVALLLADQDVPRELGVVGVLGQEVAQQPRGPLDVAPRLLQQLEEAAVVGARPPQGHRLRP